MAEKVIPPEMVPDVGSEILEIDGKRYLQNNDAMFTFYKRTKGEFSPYFLALKERKVILGHKCPRCGLVRVPPFMLYCPEDDFETLEEIAVADTGEMLSTPPITYFAHSLFQHQVPYGRGRVLLDGADTALPVNVYTTRGILTPTVFKKGTRVKIIFRDKRTGSPADIYAVPLEEVPEDQRDVPGLQEGDLTWAQPVEPELAEGTERAIRDFRDMFDELVRMTSRVEDSARARGNLAGWQKTIQVKLPGGTFTWQIDDGKLVTREEEAASPDVVMVAQDSSVFTDWMALRGSLTNSIISGQLWINVNEEFVTVFKLDRLPRSLRRSG